MTPAPAPAPTSTPEPAPAPKPSLAAQPTPFTAADIVLPEGFEADEASQSAFVGLVNKYNIPREAVNELIGLQAKAMNGISEEGNALWDTTQTAWQDEVIADPEIGGDNLDGHLTAISRMVDYYGGPELREMMDLTGAGNNVHMVKFLAKVAMDLGEPGPVSGRPGAVPKDPATILYPNQGKT